jgi:hypothetical protein
LGEFRKISDNSTRIVADIAGNPTLRIHDVDDWGLVGAVKTVTWTQKELSKIPLNEILRVLQRSMDFFCADRSEYETIVRLTGSPIEFVEQGGEFVKSWCRYLHDYLSKALPDKRAEYRNSAPVVDVLPGNSDQELLYVVAQTLASRNAAIVRPSSKGAGAYVAKLFAEALNKAVDNIGQDYLLPLKRAVNFVYTPTADVLSNLYIDGWNYLIFGGDATVRQFEQAVRSFCQPRKVIGYGTGLSMTIVADGELLDERVDKIIKSVIINRGDECDSTDIIYIQNDVYDAIVQRLKRRCKDFHSGNPFDIKTIGLVYPENADFIIGELKKRGKTKYLNSHVSKTRSILSEFFDLSQVSELQETYLIHPSVIELSEYDSAIEYPGPIVSIRSFNGEAELEALVKKDLRDNGMNRNLVTSIFCVDEKKFNSILSFLNSYTVNWNIPTHIFNASLPHQGVYIVTELVAPVYVDTPV